MIKKSMTLASVMLLGLVFLAGPSFAQGSTGSSSEINPWQDCGIGAIIFPQYRVPAAISNIIWDLGTTAVSSKLSSPESCKGSRVTAALFINETYSQLANDTAAGHGDYLAAMAKLMGCNEAAYPQFVDQVRHGMARTLSEPGFATLTKTHKAEKYFYVVDDVVKTKLSGQCHAT